MDSPDVVYYTLGNESEIIDISISIELFLIFTISFLLSVFFIILPVAIAKYKKINSIAICVIRKKINLSSNIFYLFLSAIFFLYIAIFSAILLHADEYLKLILSEKIKPSDSKFYTEEYITPNFDNVIFPENKRNLVFIFLESMESSYTDFQSGGLFEKNLIPNLTDIANKNISFSNNHLLGGGVDVIGTGWTVAGILSKFSGLPYKLSEKNQTEKNFLPNAITLTDILAKNGYRQRFIFGSKKHFARRDILLETHGAVEIHDIEWYKENNMLEKNYHKFWGFEDIKLYEFAKYELTELSQQKEPFMFGMLTVDTHMPEGYICELCEKNENWQIKNVITCADRQIANFMNWAEKQNWYSNTLFVIVGDHFFMTGDNTNFLKNEKNDTEIEEEKMSPFFVPKNERRWINIFINAQPTFFDKTDSFIDVFSNRNFCAFDIFPTTLSALGCEIKENRLGFGTDLFSGEKTIIERYKIEYINQEISKKNIQYENLAGSKWKMKK